MGADDPFARLRELSGPGVMLDPDLLARLLEALPDAIIIVDAQGVIRLVNMQAELVFGYPRSDMLGKPVEMLLPTTLRETHVHHRQHFFMDPHTRPMGLGLSLHGQHQNGMEMPLEINLSPIVASQGVYTVAVIRKKREAAHGAP